MTGVEDEYGVEWVVRAGDPGSTHVNKLKALGYRWVVLPRKVICGRLDVSSASQDVPPFLPVGIDKQRLLRRARLIDCLEALSG